METPRGTQGPSLVATVAVVWVALAASLAIGLAIKAPCADHASWADGRPFLRFCYSDIVPLYENESLSGDRLPYLDTCPDPFVTCDEYPPVTMYAMRLAATVGNALGGGSAPFFYVNAAMLIAASVLTCYLLVRLAGRAALFFAAAPTLVLYGFMNWDLVAVVLATAGLFLFLRRRDGASGATFGLGVSAKLYPLVLAVTTWLDRHRREPKALRGSVYSFGATWLATNVPFALLGPVGWMSFYQRNTRSYASHESLWSIGCRNLSGATWCLENEFVNPASGVTFLVFSLLVYRIAVRRQPDLPRWTLAFPLLAVFLLTAKLYSPQFSLWLLPLIALVLPDVKWFVAFQFTEVLLFYVRMSWIGSVTGLPGLSLGVFEAVAALHALVLAALVIVFLRRLPCDFVPHRARMIR